MEVYDFRQVRDAWFLVMEYVPGRTLREALRAVDMDTRERLAALADAGEALAAAHASGIVHRDVKAANVLLRGDGRAKLTDFGLAGMNDPGAFGTQAGGVAGTARYLAPEVRAGAEPGGAADVFAFATLVSESVVAVEAGAAAAVGRALSARPTARPSPRSWQRLGTVGRGSGPRRRCRGSRCPR